MDNLARNSILDRKAGMSYGQWKALHPVTSEGKKEKPHPRQRDIVCAYCGKTFSTNSKSTIRKYCDDFCRVEMDKQRKREETSIKKKRRGTG